MLFLLAERMRNAGKFTIADVLSFRLNERPARVAAALGTLVVVAFYLIAQMVGAGALINALVGIDFSLAVIVTGAFMLVYVVFGGMLATTWVQIVKAVLLMTATVVLSLFVLAEIGWNPIDIFNDAQAQSDDGAEYLAPGLRFTKPIDTISLGLGLVLGTAGLPHILMRFFTVPDAKAARSSVGWAVGPDRRLLRHDHLPRLRRQGDPRRGRDDRRGRRGRQPRRAAAGAGGRRRRRHDRRRRVPGDHRRGRVRDDPRGRRRARDLGVRRGRARRLVERDPQAARTPSTRRSTSRGSPRSSIGAIAIVIAVIGGSDLNVSYMVGLAFAVAASANFPALLLALTWKRFNTTGAVTGVLFGVVSSIGLVVVRPGCPGRGQRHHRR